MNYLFLLKDGTTKRIRATNFKMAIWALGKITGTCENYAYIFKKSLNGFSDDDTEGIIKLFNHFTLYKAKICEVYEIKQVIYMDCERVEEDD